ncbi:MAG: class I SAM-dependent methyltransferase [Acidimicrobiales bacterium]
MLSSRPHTCFPISKREWRCSTSVTGPGTITRGPATRLALGRVVGIDASPEVIEEARAMAMVAGPAPGAAGAALERLRLTFVVGDPFDLGFDDGTFDVVHAHQVLQHVGDPVAALREMTCRPGGMVVVRDAYYPAMTFFPPDTGLDDALAASRAPTGANGAQCDAGGKLYGWARQSGFASAVPSASAWCFGAPDERRWWGDLWADRMTESSVASQLVDRGIATEDDLARFGAAWRRWAGEPDGWFAVLHGEVICTV